MYLPVVYKQIIDGKDLGKKEVVFRKHTIYEKERTMMETSQRMAGKDLITEPGGEGV